MAALIVEPTFLLIEVKTSFSLLHFKQGNTQSEDVGQVLKKPSRKIWQLCFIMTADLKKGE